MTRDIPFDEHTPEAPAHVRENFADIRPLAEVESMRRRWADRLREAEERAAERFDIAPPMEMPPHPVPGNTAVNRRNFLA
jgi:hypothetical protein